MPFELWVAAGITLVVFLGWASVLSSTGIAEAPTFTGFRFRNLLRRTEIVRWDELRGPCSRFETFLPRIVIRRIGSSFFRLGRSYAILTDRTAPDVLRLVEKRYEVRESRLESHFQ